MSKRVVITGRGTITAFGETWEDNKTNIFIKKINKNIGFVFYLLNMEVKSSGLINFMPNSLAFFALLDWLLISAITK